MMHCRCYKLHVARVTTLIDVSCQNSSINQTSDNCCRLANSENWVSLLQCPTTEASSTVEHCWYC